MNQVARKRRVPRRRLRRRLAPARLVRPRPPAPRRKRRWPRALAVLAVLLAIWLLWPAAEPPPQATEVKLAGPAPAPPAPAADKPAAVRKPPAAPKPEGPSPMARARRELLLAAVRARSPSLRPCVPGNAAEARVPVRLHVARAGAVKGVEFAGEPPAAEVRDCVRKVTSGWNFRDVELPSDVELFATLTLTPGA